VCDAATIGTWQNTQQAVKAQQARAGLLRPQQGSDQLSTAAQQHCAKGYTFMLTYANRTPLLNTVLLLWFVVLQVANTLATEVLTAPGQEVAVVATTQVRPRQQ
jgi:hypothetical protein